MMAFAWISWLCIVGQLLYWIEWFMAKKVEARVATSTAAASNSTYSTMRASFLQRTRSRAKMSRKC